MNDNHFLGDDRELPPRKLKEIEWVTRRLIVAIALSSAVIGGVAGSISALVLNKAFEAHSGLESTLVALQNTQTLHVLPDYSATESALNETQIAIEMIYAAPTEPPLPTPLPTEVCYCDTPQCLAGSVWLERGETLTTFSTDPQKFGWYLVYNTTILGNELHLFPASHLYTCDLPFDSCDVRGYFNSRACAVSYGLQFCQSANCQFLDATPES